MITWPKWMRGSLAPDFVVGLPEAPYLLRWYIVPRNPWFGIYLHKFVRSDYDRALHDHPKDNISIILRGQYLEHFKTHTRLRRAGHIIARRAETAHRVELMYGQPCWSLFLTGRERRQWGFHCPSGWRHWKDVVTIHESGNQTADDGCS